MNQRSTARHLAMAGLLGLGASGCATGLFQTAKTLPPGGVQVGLGVSHLLTAEEVKKLAHAIELFNHGLYGAETRGNPAFSGRKLTNENAPWTPEDDALLVHLAVEKYDYTFGDVWLYVSWEMQRSMDEVADRFSEIFLKPKNKSRGACEVLLTKSFRPLLMNRQFRLVPPQCYVVPSEGHLGGAQVTPFILPSGFAKYATKQT